MNRLKRTLRNIVIIIALFLLVVNRSGLYLTPMSAHKHSERSIHYGPSEVVHIEENGKEKYILGKYDKWVSCNTVKKSLFFFWHFGNQVTGFENDITKDINHSWNGSDQYYRLYGIKNNENIERVEFTLESGEVHSTTTFYDDLFLIIFKASDTTKLYITNIKGYDNNDSLVYEVEQ